jgi:hypothetical protein
MSLIDFSCVETPACTHRKELFTIAARGKQSKISINKS